MPPSPPSVNWSHQFALVASPFQPALEKTPLETFIEGLIAEDEVSSKDLQTAFDACLSQLDKGSYYGYLACQILQYAATTCSLSDNQINQLKEYFTRNLTYESTRAGERLFGELTRSTAAGFLLFINETIRALPLFPSTRQNSADQHLPAREPLMEF
ncbi:MAG: hypothetical protein JNN09_07880 [Alphaproteobacteria bacterium]|nr:hypothetical protein [Alphaproteobacteria bacterium]